MSGLGRVTRGAASDPELRDPVRPTRRPSPPPLNPPSERPQRATERPLAMVRWRGIAAILGAAVILSAMAGGLSLLVPPSPSRVERSRERAGLVRSRTELALLELDIEARRDHLLALMKSGGGLDARALGIATPPGTLGASPDVVGPHRRLIQVEKAALAQRIAALSAMRLDLEERQRRYLDGR